MTPHLDERLSRRERLGNLRHLQAEQNLIDFSSNDYLGLARSSELAACVAREWEACAKPLNGLGSTGSRLLTGNTAYAQGLEERIAQFHGYEAGILFNCGYMANVGLLSTVAGTGKDTIFFDAAVHASTHDGIRLSRAKAVPFRHNGLEHLENRLKNHPSAGNRFICIESIYSTDGSKAPLLEISRLAKEYGAHLIVDEAHAVGACGPEGRGLVAEQNLCPQVFAQVITFGKALGTYGAIVLGSQALKETLINFSTPYIYTTALPFHALAAIKCSYGLFPGMERERRYLQRLIRIFHHPHPSHSLTHIQGVRIEGNAAVREAAKMLAAQGLDVRPLMSPTVRKGHETLRICLHAFNTPDEVGLLLGHIEAHRRPSHA